MGFAEFCEDNFSLISINLFGFYLMFWGKNALSMRNARAMAIKDIDSFEIMVLWVKKIH
jgi:hypothetical protein